MLKYTILLVLALFFCVSLIHGGKPAPDQSDESEEDSEESSDDDLEYGSDFEGDINLTAEQREILNNPDEDDSDDDDDNNDDNENTGLISLYYRWPKDDDGTVIVPFVLSEDYCKYFYNL